MDGLFRTDDCPRLYYKKNALTLSALGAPCAFNSCANSVIRHSSNTQRAGWNGTGSCASGAICAGASLHIENAVFDLQGLKRARISDVEATQSGHDRAQIGYAETSPQALRQSSSGITLYSDIIEFIKQR